MTQETELKLWHWYAEAEPGDTCVVVMPIEEQSEGFRCVYVGRDRRARQVGRTLDEHARLHIGPIAGPGEPPPAPKDREDAERMAREWASKHGLHVVIDHDRVSRCHTTGAVSAECTVYVIDPTPNSHNTLLAALAAREFVLTRSAIEGADWERRYADSMLERDAAIAKAMELERERDTVVSERDEWKRRAGEAERKFAEAHDDAHALGHQLREARDHTGRRFEQVGEGARVALATALGAPKSKRSLADLADEAATLLLSRDRSLRQVRKRNDDLAAKFGEMSGEVDRLERSIAEQAGLPDEPPAGHRRVPLAVAIRDDGMHYGCSGDLEEVNSWARRQTGLVHVVRVEADVPLPRQPETVRGRVLS